ncbi:MAG TPA: TatD family hydrolase [Candidatus Saccharimonadales bacterium]|nr:TatD family hydrolase [Candidatus Saccharimonadales bacterium]
MQELVDTHCHIQSIGSAKGERVTREIWAKVPGLTADGVIATASEHGVTRLVCVGCDLQDSRLAIDFAKNRQSCWATIGIHPHEAKHFAGQSAKLQEFSKLATRPKVVAVGECGLDYYYEHSPKTTQIEVLKFQIELAQKYNLPLIFHVREALDDFWPVLDSYKGLRGVLHSFTDSAENLAKALDRGLFIGVNGIATFAKNPAQLEVYRSIPLKSLLLETDAPFLTPTPYRGSINEPKRVGVVADFLANLRGENRADLAETTTANARQLFGI